MVLVWHGIAACIILGVERADEGRRQTGVPQVGGQGVTGRAPWLEPLALVGNQTVFTHTHIHTKVQTYRKTEIHKHKSSKA